MTSADRPPLTRSASERALARAGSGDPRLDALLGAAAEVEPDAVQPGEQSALAAFQMASPAGVPGPAPNAEAREPWRIRVASRLSARAVAAGVAMVVATGGIALAAGAELPLPGRSADQRQHTPSGSPVGERERERDKQRSGDDVQPEGEDGPAARSAPAEEPAGADRRRPTGAASQRPFEQPTRDQVGAAPGSRHGGRPDRGTRPHGPRPVGDDRPAGETPDSRPGPDRDRTRPDGSRPDGSRWDGSRNGSRGDGSREDDSRWDGLREGGTRPEGPRVSDDQGRSDAAAAQLVAPEARG